MSKLISVYDTKLISDKLLYEITYLPYKMIRTDTPPCENQPDVDMRHSYWTHQLYNFCPVNNPDYYENAGLESSNNPIYLDVLGYLEAKCPDLPPRAHLYSAYINVLKYGNSPAVHVDAPYHVDSNKTVLVYLNPEWNWNWGGETMFFDHNLEAKRVVSFRPGRVVLFDGRLPHLGCAPSAHYLYNRYIMAFKFMDPDVRQKLFDKYDMENHPPVFDMGVMGFSPKVTKQLWENNDAGI